MLPGAKSYILILAALVLVSAVGVGCATSTNAQNAPRDDETGWEETASVQSRSARSNNDSLVEPLDAEGEHLAEVEGREKAMDIQLHYTEYGDGDPLILLHGNGEDGSYFVHQIEYFMGRYRVIALDTRGHGGSPRGTAPFTLDQFARDLDAFMDELDIDSAHILGFSDGANIAILFALEHPERVKSLILDGGNLFPEGLTEPTRREIDEEFEDALAAGDESRLELLRLMIDEPHIDPASLSSIDAPTLVVAGTDDVIEEEHTRLIADSIPGARLALIEGTHFVAADNPDEFNRIVGAFLAEC